jgi:hypothetical protein
LIAIAFILLAVLFLCILCDLKAGQMEGQDLAIVSKKYIVIFASAGIVLLAISLKMSPKKTLNEAIIAYSVVFQFIIFFLYILLFCWVLITVVGILLIILFTLATI